jgi:thiol-disulfide isomerase/thioredoxin
MLSTLTAAALALAPLAASDTLKPGDPAPALQVQTWLKGDAVPTFEKGKVYVVEFWATWCGPCIASMPHLSALQAQYKDQGVTLIGMTSADDRGNTLEKAKTMVAAKGDTMGYTVAWDTERKTNEAYMQAAGQGGIPCSFLIDKQGKVAYIGHPMWLDEPLAAVVAGKWDIAKDGAQMESIQKEFYALLGEKDAQAALKGADAFAAKYPAYAARLDDVRFGKNLELGNYAAAWAVADHMVEHAIKTKDASSLNQVAWTIVDPEAPWKERNLDLALRAATKASELTGDKDPSILDTLARVYFLKGDAKKALELQKKAVELADPRLKPSLEKALAEYEKGLQ